MFNNIISRAYIMRIFILQIVLGSCFLQRSYASHAAGGDLIYRWVSDSTYEFTFKFYRDCSSSVPAPLAVSLCYHDNCEKLNFYTSLPAISQLPDGSPNGSVLNAGCPQYATTCTDPNSAISGFQEWWYSGTVTLPYRCSLWTFSMDVQARNFTITNIVPTPALQFPADFSLFLQATLNTQEAQGASSPYFTTKPVPYVCVNEPYSYNNGVVDPDGDSLSFVLIHSLADDANCAPVIDSLPFASPIYNLTDNPLSCNNTFQLSAATGQMTYTPDVQQRAILTLQTRKYRNGMLISTTMRDVQVIVVPCTSEPPQFTLDSINITGATYYNGVINACSGNNLNFCIKTTSAAPDAALISSSDADSAAQGAQVTYNGLGTDSMTACINWTPTLQQAGMHVIVFTIYDSTCRAPGIIVPRSFGIPVYVYPTIQAMPDTTICAGDSMTLRVIGGSGFTWSVIAGDLNSLSCNDCIQPHIYPRLTTTYQVQNNYFNTIACKTVDTVMVTVVHVPGIDTTITKCGNDTIQLPLDMYGSNSAAYHFLWTPPLYISNDTAVHPFCWAPSDANYVPFISLDSGSMACLSVDTVRIRIINKFLHASDTGMCPGDTITIHALGGYKYRWQPGGAIYISDTTIADPQVSPSTDCSYIVYGINAYGCEDTATAHVRVFPNAVVQLPDSVVLYYGESFPFNPQTNCTIFNWFPPLGLSADNIANPVAAPPVDTRYRVTATTEEGCTVQQYVNVFRSDEVLLALPDAFSPGNGPNNILKPIYRGDITLDYLRIFSRWGQLVFESNNLDAGWDGEWHGTPQPEGVFIYTMQGHTTTGRILAKEGNITLLR